MRMIDCVGSSRLRRWGWECESRGSDVGTFVVEFVDGSTWAYARVPAFVVGRFQVAPSLGRYFENFIKGDYECRRLWGVDLEALTG